MRLYSTCEPMRRCMYCMYVLSAGRLQSNQRSIYWNLLRCVKKTVWIPLFNWTIKVKLFSTVTEIWFVEIAATFFDDPDFHQLFYANLHIGYLYQNALKYLNQTLFSAKKLIELFQKFPTMEIGSLVPEISAPPQTFVEYM